MRRGHLPIRWRRACGPRRCACNSTRRQVLSTSFASILAVSVPRAHGSAGNLQPCASARDEVLATLAASPDAAFADLNDGLKLTIDALIKQNPSAAPGPETFTLGQGYWRVFHAPHLTGLSKALGARIDPLVYELAGKTFVSNARYSHPLFGRGWLSASGTMEVEDDSTVKVLFDRFWVDGYTSLRRTIDAESTWDAGDKLVTAIGRASFFPALALFPVRYLDKDVAVFRFPPLSSDISVVRMRPEELPL